MAPETYLSGFLKSIIAVLSWICATLKEPGDPDGEKLTKLSQRDRELVAAFAGNGPDIKAGLRALYRDDGATG